MTEAATAICCLIGRVKKLMEKAKEVHHHKCPDIRCGHIWSHRMADLDDFESGHTCPKCGVGKVTKKCQPNGSPL